MSSEYKTPVIVDVIGSIVDAMREHNTVASFVEVTGRYTIQSTNELTTNDVIVINSIDYVVSVIDSSSFVITGEPSIDFTGETWKAKAPYYLHGHPTEIVTILSEKNKGGILAYQKYPLIALFQDFKEGVERSYTEATLTLVIVNGTQANYRADERYQHNFKPILYPLLYNFDYFLKQSEHLFSNIFTYDKTDRLYWGKEGLYQNEGNVFNDFVDAIEIENLILKFTNNCMK